MRGTHGRGHMGSCEHSDLLSKCLVWPPISGPRRGRYERLAVKITAGFFKNVLSRYRLPDPRCCDCARMYRLRDFACAVACVCLGLYPSPGAFAHTTVTSHHGLPQWNFDPGIVTPLLFSALLFGAGWRRLRSRSRRGANQLLHRARLFGSGWIVLSLALVSPLHEAGELAFCAHMVEHELIMLVAAPLLVFSKPLPVMLWALPSQIRQPVGSWVVRSRFASLWGFLSAPVTATIIQAGVLWLWHMPTLFNLALASEWWHAVQHAAFLTAALLFWYAMLARHRSISVAALCLVITSIVSGALGALMAFASSPWYSGYSTMGMAPFGLTPAEDQQLAGLIMWVPGGLVHAGAALLLMQRLWKPVHG